MAQHRAADVGAIIDVTSLRANPGFRWLFASQIGAQTSRFVLVVAAPYQIFVLTNSSLLVGLVGLVQVAPIVLFSLVGGTIADAFDRRRVLVTVQLLMALTSLGLAANAGAGATVWPVFVLVAAHATLMGVENPSQSAVIPALVSRGQLPGALALNQSLTQAAQVVAPVLAGVMMATFGVAAAYLVAAAAVGAGALALLPLDAQRPHGATGRMSLSATVEGWRYLRGTPLLQQIMLIDVSAMVFGMPRALFPVIGLEVLGGDAATVGLLHAAPGAGALLGALTTGWVTAVSAQGRAVVHATVVWGLAIAAFGLSRSLWLSLGLLAVAGAADVVSNVFRNTVLQLAVPDRLRGRINAFNGALTKGGPPLGDAEAGAVAAVTTPTISVVSGGLLSVAGSLLIAWRGRALWQQRRDDTPTDPGAQGPGGSSTAP